MIQVPVSACCTDASTPTPREPSSLTIQPAWALAEPRSPTVTKRAAV